MQFNASRKRSGFARRETRARPQSDTRVTKRQSADEFR
jgi:hypothetical protein